MFSPFFANKSKALNENTMRKGKIAEGKKFKVIGDYMKCTLFRMIKYVQKCSTVTR